MHPLALSTGAGAEARNAIGTVIVGGVSVSTLLTTLVVPSLYLLIGGYSKPSNLVSEIVERLRAREAAAAAPPPEKPGGRLEPAE